MIKAIIVEDEVHGMDNLKNLLRKYCPSVEVIGEARSIEEAEACIKANAGKIDLAFLDINLPDGLVFQLFKQVSPINFEVIFITGHEQFAIKACNYSAIGYILKPIDPENLIESVARVSPRSAENGKIDKRLELFNQYYNNPNAFEKMSISALDGIYFINIRDIVRLEAEDNYTHIYLNSKKKLTASKTIKAYEEMLSGVNFYRVHKTHLINLNYMQKFVKGDGGYLVMDDGKEIDVSRRRRAAFMEQMKKLQEEL